jgi:8-oxo-dGTP diphosphatase
LRVVAGALQDAEGRVLIAQRPIGKPLAGRWEFPGGKLAAGESAEAALQRELREELGVELREWRWLLDLPADYGDRRITLHCFVVTAFDGQPQSLDGQALLWVPLDELGQHDILEADLPFIAALQRLGGRAR